ACLNIKKLAKMLKLRDLKGSIFLSILGILSKIMIRYKKTNQLLFMSNWFVFNLKIKVKTFIFFILFVVIIYGNSTIKVISIQKEW
ncbi:hypothetical protein ACODHD_13185, partial [Vagococcus fluvialis]|uniref:hypothetical protein n=1 Tax=Vagococcus fluvialis TaxID=2738 RepID=UPI003B5AC1CC